MLSMIITCYLKPIVNVCVSSSPLSLSTYLYFYLTHQLLSPHITLSFSLPPSLHHPSLFLSPFFTPLSLSLSFLSLSLSHTHTQTLALSILKVWKLPNTKCKSKYPLEAANHKVQIKVPDGKCQTQSAK